VERLSTAILINVVPAVAAVLSRSLTLTGALAGALIGIVIYAGSGGSGWSILAFAFILTVSSTRVGYARKAEAGIAEERGGRRGAGSVIANCLVGAIGAVLIAASADDRLGALVLVTGLTAGASDTVASEVGKAFGRKPRAVPSMTPVPPGTPGAVSMTGTLAGLVAALAMALAAAAVRVPGFAEPMVAIVVVGATLGAFVESALATWLEPRGLIDNDALNFINTVVAAVAAVAAS
jgi:uncharacterized protein (TIGR00297 family)